jgi:hypothetical protein
MAQRKNETREEYNARHRQQYAANPEKNRGAVRRYRVANPEKILEYAREYRVANREKVLEYQRQRYAANREQILEGMREYRVANPEKIRDRGRTYRAANREKVRGSARKSRTGMPPDMFQALLIDQAGLCAICDRPMIGHTEPAADHDHHNPGVWRGLLCVGCNSQLHGLENLPWRAKAEAYLAAHTYIAVDPEPMSRKAALAVSLTS